MSSKSGESRSQASSVAESKAKGKSYGEYPTSSGNNSSVGGIARESDSSE